VIVWSDHAVAKVTFAVAIVVSSWALQAKAESSASAQAKALATKLVPHTGKGKGKGTPPREYFAKLRKLYAEQAAKCPLPKKERKAVCKDEPSSDQCKQCRELDAVLRWLVEGTHSYLVRLNTKGFTNAQVLDDASEAINSAYVVDPENAEEVARLVAYVVEVARKNHADAHQLLRVVEFIGDPRVTKHLQDRIKAAGQVPEPIKQMTQEGASSTQLIDAYLRLDRVWKVKVMRWLNEADPSYRAKIEHALESAKAVSIVVRRPPASHVKAEKAARELVNSFVFALSARTAEGPYRPRYVSASEWDKGRAKAEEDCREQKCDVVLALCTAVAATGAADDKGCSWSGQTGGSALPELRVSASLSFVNAQNPLGVPAEAEEPLEVAVPLGNPGAHDETLIADAFDAAEGLMTKIGARIEIVGGAQLMASGGQITIRRPVREGVTIYGEPGCLSAGQQTQLRGKGVKIVGTCGPVFDERFKAGLSALRDTVGAIDTPTEATPVLTIAPNPAAEGSCRGTLTNGVEKESRYRFWTIVSDASAGKRGDSGADAASRLAELYGGPSCNAQSGNGGGGGGGGAGGAGGGGGGGGGGPPPPEPAGTFHFTQALVLTGLPWLTDHRRSKGDRAALMVSIADVSLLALGASSVAYSTRLRDQYATGDGSALGKANFYRSAGLLTLGVVILGRVIGAAVYGSGPGEASNDRGGEQ
jgi:hypothetical protein